MMAFSATLPGVERVLDKQQVCGEFDLPLDREGDVVVMSDATTCIGTTPAAHDLKALAGHRLRTHGGLSESRVPFILNRPLNPAYAARAARGILRNFHIFDFAINGTA